MTHLLALAYVVLFISSCSSSPLLVSNPSMPQVPSHDDSSHEPSRHNTHTSSGRPSPHQSPRPSSMHSPPITPAATRSRDAIDGTVKGATFQKVKTDEDPAAVTPQISLPNTSPSTTNIDD